MWAQSLLEYGAVSVLVEAFTNLWIGVRESLVRMNPAWLVVLLVLYLLFRRRK